MTSVLSVCTLPAHMFPWCEMRSLWPEMEARNIRAYGVQATVHVNNIITVARHNFFSDCRQELVVSIFSRRENFIFTINLCFRKFVLVMSPIWRANSLILHLEWGWNSQLIVRVGGWWRFELTCKWVSQWRGRRGWGGWAGTSQQPSVARCRTDSSCPQPGSPPCWRGGSPART